MIFGGNGEHRVLDVLILVYLSLVEALVEVRRIIVLVGYPNANEFRYCNTSKKICAVRSLPMNYIHHLQSRRQIHSSPVN